MNSKAFAERLLPFTVRSFVVFVGKVFFCAFFRRMSMAASGAANAEANVSRYSVCGCHRAPMLAWDPHPVCPHHLNREHYVGAADDFHNEATPRCPMCATMTRANLQQWLSMYELVHHIQPEAMAN